MRKIFNYEEKLLILENTNSRCAHCGKKLELNDMTVEHIWPISKGGGDEIYNTVALCKKCNNFKSNFIYDLSTFYTYVKEEVKDKYNINYYNYLYQFGKDKVLGNAIGYYEYIPIGAIKSVICNNHKRIKKINNKALRQKVSIVEIWPGDRKCVIEYLSNHITQIIKKHRREDITSVINTYLKKENVEKYVIEYLIDEVMSYDLYGVYNRQKEIVGLIGYNDGISHYSKKDKLHPFIKMGFIDSYMVNEILSYEANKNIFENSPVINVVANIKVDDYYEALNDENKVARAICIIDTNYEGIIKTLVEHEIVYETYKNKEICFIPSWTFSNEDKWNYILSSYMYFETPEKILEIMKNVGKNYEDIIKEWKQQLKEKITDDKFKFLVEELSTRDKQYDIV